jgi:hypothetical protein
VVFGIYRECDNASGGDSRSEGAELQAAECFRGKAALFFFLRHRLGRFGFLGIFFLSEHRERGQRDYAGKDREETTAQVQGRLLVSKKFHLRQAGYLYGILLAERSVHRRRQ